MSCPVGGLYDAWMHPAPRPRSRLSALAVLTHAALLLGACGPGDKPPAPVSHLQWGSPWPKFRGDARQTGRTAYKPPTTGGALWDFRTGKGIFSSPVIGADGTIYIGSADRTFYAVNPDGSFGVEKDSYERDVRVKIEVDKVQQFSDMADKGSKVANSLTGLMGSWQKTIGALVALLGAIGLLAWKLGLRKAKPAE